MKTTDKKERGKKARKSGGEFERRVRAYLEDNGWTVTKWQNQVDFDKNSIIPAPHKFNFFTKTFSNGHGFPDFVCFRKEIHTWSIIGVEAKSAKYLDKEEKAKCKWYLEHGIFDQIIVYYKDKGTKRGNIKGHISSYLYEEGK